MSSTVFACAAASGRIVSEEREHFRDVLRVLRAELLGLVVGLRVVVAVGQTQTPLGGSRDHFARVLAVLLRAETEERADSVGLQARQLHPQIGEVLNLLDARQFRRERLRAGGFDRRFIHAARVEVADFLLLRAGRGLLRGEPFQDLPHRHAVSLGQLGEGAPVRVLGRDRIPLQPASVRELVIILASPGRRVHIRRIEPVGSRGGGCRRSRPDGSRRVGLREDRAQRADDQSQDKRKTTAADQRRDTREAH